jgi:hypothetical protein
VTALAATSAFAGDPPTPPAIGLFAGFDAKPSPAFLQAMENELSAILLPAHLRLRWILPGENSGAETWMGKLTLRFHGTCAAAPRHAPRLETVEPGQRISLADTAVEGGTILPYTEVDCDLLRAFLAMRDSRAAGAETRLGVAMARVVAHEMYHVLLQTSQHSATGIASAVETPAALLGRSLLFEHGELQRIPGRSPSGPPPGSP